MALGYLQWDQEGLFDEKNRLQNSHVTVPLNNFDVHCFLFTYFNAVILRIGSYIYNVNLCAPFTNYLC